MNTTTDPRAISDLFAIAEHTHASFSVYRINRSLVWMASWQSSADDLRGRGHTAEAALLDLAGKVRAHYDEGAVFDA